MAKDEERAQLTPRPPYIGPDRERFEKATLQNSSTAFDDVSDDNFNYVMETMAESATGFARLAAKLDSVQK